MRYYKMAWLLITDKNFRYYLNEILWYALSGYDKLRGTGSSQALHFDMRWTEVIYNKKFLQRLELNKKLFLPPNH